MFWDFVERQTATNPRKRASVATAKGGTRR